MRQASRLHSFLVCSQFYEFRFFLGALLLVGCTSSGPSGSSVRYMRQRLSNSLLEGSQKRLLGALPTGSPLGQGSDGPIHGPQAGTANSARSFSVLSNFCWEALRSQNLFTCRRFRLSGGGTCDAGTLVMSALALCGKVWPHGL